MKEKIVVGVAGMPGSGKAAVKEIAQEKAYSMVEMGDEIREEAKRRKLKPTPKNLGQLMLKLREEAGQAVVARRCVPKIERAEEKVVIVDGIRSLHEVDELKKRFSNFFLIAIHTSPETRFQRLFQRKRSDDPKSWETFMERDLRELSVGLGDVIATADYMLVNEGTRVQLKRKVLRVLRSVVEKWMR
ncbi:MAG: flagellar hook-basal body complex protein FliE [Candidatus Bathyarchaeota archaeon]|nr:MAG: flagellar hook-basal body complex protein FliE [Candidatus Bathyarchaeota archaeon]